MDKSFYIYGHYKKTDGSLFYIGKGHGRRAYESRRRNLHWRNTVNKHGYTVQILHDDLTEEEAFAREKDLIAEHGRQDLDTGCLVNMTDGGEGSVGFLHSEKTRQLLSDLKKNRTQGPHTEETKKKMSEAAKKLPPKSEEHRRKISETVKRLPHHRKKPVARLVKPTGVRLSPKKPAKRLVKLGGATATKIKFLFSLKKRLLNQEKMFHSGILRIENSINL